MNCETARTFLDAYSTNELDLASATEVEQHLAACPACAKELEDLLALRGKLSEPSLRYRAPMALRTMLAGEIEAAPQRNHWRFTKIAAAILLFLLPCLGWYETAASLRAAQFADAITASHVRSMMGDHLLDVRSTDQHTVKPWFSGKIDFSPTVIDLASDGFPLLGGRLDYMNGRSVAAIVYQRGKHLINVFVWPVDESDGEPKASQHNGYNLLTWTHGGLKYVAVSDVNAQDLTHLADLIRSPRPATRP